MKKLELLAPAGSLDSLKAAVWAGADAVYFGCKGFNARAFAGNFEGEELLTAFRLCRLYGVKIYITLNTLVSDKEISDAVAMVAELEATTPPDAYIVQDLGLVKALKNKFPSLPIHASTQMQQHSADGIEYLKKMGISRVVIAREAAASDIEEIAAADIETEVFVHGALCVCQSGGCLMSSFIGGRSGNRGECAQPCRQSYNGKYPLSLKDLCLAGHVPRLAEMGVDCLKIEGRMKSPEYVYETVSIYRSLIDENRKPTAFEKERLVNAFSRSGFTDGYFVGKVGKDMFGIRTESDKLKSKNAEIRIEEKKLHLKIFCRIARDERAYVSAKIGNYFAEVYGAVPEEARTKPISEAELKTRLAKTGGTPFSAEVTVELDEGLILPMSSVNELRRSAVTKLWDLIVESNTPARKEQALVSNPLPCAGQSCGPYLVARFEGGIPSERVLSIALSKCKRVELPLWSELPKIKQTEKLSLVLPRVIFPKDKRDVKSLIKKATENGVGQFTLSNFAHLPYCRNSMIHGDYIFNVTNGNTASLLGEWGLSSLVLSPEVHPRAVKSTIPAEYIVYGRIPLMHTESCIITNAVGCKKKGKCTCCIKDKTGASFPVIREYGHRNTVYNSVPTYLIDKCDKIGGGHIVMFTNESEDEIIAIFNAYDKKMPPFGSFTRGAMKREGSVFEK